MPDAVKSTRSYESPRRRDQAETTRQMILTAAQRRFEHDGYTATTIAAIAREAGVSPKTVYLAFESKSGLLRAVWHLLLRGDAGETPMAERPFYEELLAEPDAGRQLTILARNSRQVKERAGRLLSVIRSAASVDPDSAALWNRIQTEFYGMQPPIIESLRRKKALLRGLDPVRAADLLWTLNHPDVWLLLVHERGWTPAEWEAWFAETARSQLLDPGYASPPGA
ncbi:MAG TPA: helix-turn-helix domain-containing protein [Gaiellaceae bacterium]|jgi:AcrR family transcriptional regulator|nr:helix-turn-helix domain-containing protein [Gaiellaceae bacterium]